MRCKIPVGDIELNGKLILPKYALNEKNMPKAEFGKLPLITQVKPDEEKDVPIFANSEAAFTFPIGQKVLFDKTDKNGHTVTHNFRLLISRYDFYKGGKS